ncbi:MAG: BREX system P-loop protein BrxC [Coriobacteriia bacterium]|nr:BREX system P-loop protein BrxC [Coriobacteriia bacterium]
MLIRDMFAKDINRDIEGVVKVAQIDQSCVIQELSEYVVTRELSGHFSRLFEAYARSLDVPTSKMGVWISGFFGSGKSHFLKMLSYLLANPEVGGRSAVSYFDGKFDDASVWASVRRCAEVPTESILFNIDNKGPVNKDKTAILRVFARVFYENQGFYGESLKLARLESYIERKGETDAFRLAYERINGESWVETRSCYDFNSDDVVAALVETDVMSEDEARRWIDGSEEAELSVDGLTNEIRDYVTRRKAENGGRFRLVFLADEVGQYIGSDVNLMLNLQTIVEELGSKCAGDVWVMVTSQEAIDEITTGLPGNDFSKIQGRFATRLSLSSSSVDEVIKRRILDKTPQATGVLQAQWGAQSAKLRNLFSFKDARGDLTGYTSEQDFVETFPFVGYQFPVLQSVMKAIRLHGYSGKHLSEGERSMLSGFREAAQAVQECGEDALVPFWRFFDTLHDQIESHVMRVVVRAAQAAGAGDQGLEPNDVNILKLLFLVRYIDDLKATIDNVTILMADTVDPDLVTLRGKVKESLDRLVGQGYVGRAGEVYTFLTDEEQDVAREIAQMRPEGSLVTKKLIELLSDGVVPTRKLRIDGHDFPVDLYVDDTSAAVPQGGLILRFASPLWDVCRQGDEGLALSSTRNGGECLVVPLADEGETTQEYYRAIYAALQIDQYVLTKKIATLPETTQRIIRDRQGEKTNLLRRAGELLADAVRSARIFVAGEEFQLRAASTRQRIEAALGQLVSSVYPKLGYIGHPFDNEAAVVDALLGKQGRLDGVDGENERALREVCEFVSMQYELRQPVSVGNIRTRFMSRPYGWRELDVAGVLAGLLADRKINLRSSDGVVRLSGDRKTRDCLLNAREAERAIVEYRRQVDPALLRDARIRYNEVFDRADASEDPDELAGQIGQQLTELKGILKTIDAKRMREGGAVYPGEQAISLTREAMSAVLAAAESGESASTLSAFVDQGDALGESIEALDEVRRFYESVQVEIFRKAIDARERWASEQLLLVRSDEVKDALTRMSAIIAQDRPYRSISDLSDLTDSVSRAYDSQLDARRRDLLNRCEDAWRVIQDAAHKEVACGGRSSETSGRDASKKPLSSNVQRALSDVEQRKKSLESGIHSATSMTQLAAMEQKVVVLTDNGVGAVEDAFQRDVKQIERERIARQCESVGSSGGGHPVVTTRIATSAGSRAGSPDHSPIPSRPVRSAAMPVARPDDIRLVRRSDVLPPCTLRSEEEIRAYMRKVADRLVSELAGHDSIRFVG